MTIAGLWDRVALAFVRSWDRDFPDMIVADLGIVAAVVGLALVVGLATWIGDQ